MDEMEHRGRIDVDGLYTILDPKTKKLYCAIVISGKLERFSELMFFKIVFIKCERLMNFILNTPTNDDLYFHLMENDIPWLYTHVCVEYQYAGSLFRTHTKQHNQILWNQARALVNSAKDLLDLSKDDSAFEEIKFLRKEWVSEEQIVSDG